MLYVHHTSIKMKKKKSISSSELAPHCRHLRTLMPYGEGGKGEDSLHPNPGSWHPSCASWTTAPPPRPLHRPRLSTAHPRFPDSSQGAAPTSILPPDVFLHPVFPRIAANNQLTLPTVPNPTEFQAALPKFLANMDGNSPGSWHQRYP